jgi:hypothetical protein
MGSFLDHGWTWVVGTILSMVILPYVIEIFSIVWRAFRDTRHAFDPPKKWYYVRYFYWVIRELKVNLNTQWKAFRGGYEVTVRYQRQSKIKE